MKLQNTATIPRSELILGRANFPAAASVGQAVYITVPKVGSLYQTDVADPSDPTEMPAAAIIIEKTSPTEGVIQFHGPIKGVYTGLVPGFQYVVGTDGLPSTVGDANYPTPGSDILQELGIAIDDEELLLHPTGTGGGSFGPLTFDRRNVLLTRIDDRTWSVPDSFLSTTIQVYHNGRRLEWASSPDPRDGDFYVTESGGVGTGFDTVNLLRFSTNARSRVRADYIAVV